MRVGLIIYGSLDTMSGGYLYDRVMVEHLRREGDTVEIISLAWRGYARHLSDNLDGKLVRRLNDASFDVLVQDELNHPSLFWLNKRIKRRCPIISIVHHLRSSELRPAWQNALYRIPERAYLESVDGFIFNSGTTKTVVQSLIGADKPSVVAYPAGDRLGMTLSEDAIRDRVQQDQPLQVVFVGNIIERKGLHTLLDALAMLPQGSWVLTAVGGLSAEPDYVGHIHSQIARLGIGESVSLPGLMMGDALADLLAQSDVFAMPSSYEGFGIAYLEAMGFGLPAIGTTAGAAHEVITDGRDGYLVPPNDAQTLAEQLRGLADRDMLLEMSLAARHRFDQHPTWDQSAASVREFLRELTGS